jgi:CRP-like cAMP-binding protein
MASADPIRANLREVTLFRGIGGSDLNLLAGQVVPRRFRRNATIFSQGEPGDGLYIVAAGHAVITRQNPEGDELMFGLYESGEYFGELSLVDDEPRSATAVAMEDCDLLFLSRGAFRAFLKDRPTALMACLEVVVGMIRRCTDLADEIALLDVRGRLVRRLVRLARQGLLEGVEGVTPSSLHMTQQHLASMLGASRESVNRQLGVLVRQGVVRLDHGHIQIVDLHRLEEYGVGII